MSTSYCVRFFLFLNPFKQKNILPLEPEFLLIDCPQESTVKSRISIRRNIFLFSDFGQIQQWLIWSKIELVIG